MKKHVALLSAVIMVLSHVESAIAQMAMNPVMPTIGSMNTDGGRRTRSGGDSDSDSSRSDYRDKQRKLREAKAEQKQAQSDIDAKKKTKRQLESQRQPKPGQSACDTCSNIAADSCNTVRAATSLNPNPCRDGACEVSLAPIDNVCFRIYKNRGCRDILSANQRGRIEECWMVTRERELEQVNAEIERLTSEIAENRRVLDRIKEELADLEEDCPDCTTPRSQNGGIPSQFAAAMGMGSSGPSTFEKVMMGVGIGGSLFLGGLNSYFQYKSASNYASSYSQYVSNAAKLGIPFYAPSPYGSMMGGGSSLGMSGMMGMGLGGYGMTGMGMGSGFGLGYGAGLGMGGYGMSSTGMMGMLSNGMGMNLGMGGYGMSGYGMGMPSYGMSGMGAGGIGMGTYGMSGGIGIGMPGLFPGGGIFPGQNGGIAVGPYTGYPYPMNTGVGASTSIFGNSMPTSYWGSPFASSGNNGYNSYGGGYGTMAGMGMYGSMGAGLSPYSALGAYGPLSGYNAAATGYGALPSYSGLAGLGALGGYGAYSPMMMGSYSTPYANNGYPGLLGGSSMGSYYSGYGTTGSYSPDYGSSYPYSLTSTNANASSYYSQERSILGAQMNDLQARYYQLYSQMMGTGIYPTTTTTSNGARF